MFILYFYYTLFFFDKIRFITHSITITYHYMCNTYYLVFLIYTPRTRTRPLEREIIGLPVISISHLSIISLKDFYIFKITESKKNLNKN